MYQKSIQFKSKQTTYVTTAFGFFSTAYTLIFISAFLLAVMAALTRGPRPAPTTIITLEIELKNELCKILLNLVQLSIINAHELFFGE